MNLIPKNLSTLGVKLKTDARETKILSYDASLNEAVISLKEKPINGSANDALIKFLNAYFNSHVTLVRGKTIRKKLFKIHCESK